MFYHQNEQYSWINFENLVKTSNYFTRDQFDQKSDNPGGLFPVHFSREQKEVWFY